ncbi:MAG: dihydroorotase [Candidatus Omnitrophica bacterium]|nr:dihydroorotase [Candidatus Omnitrophota bacterium]
MRILIKDGRLVDPANKINQVLDILTEDNKIFRIGRRIDAKTDITIDAGGKVVMPGIVDMHIHLREPGREDKETIFSGTKSALKGGVTSVLAMPNTSPCIDTPEGVRILKGLIAKSAQANVFISAAISKNRLGKVLTDAVKLKKEGVVALTDDGSSVSDPQTLLRAFKKAKEQKTLIICHSEDHALSNNGSINLGLMSTRLGLKGIPRESEYKIVQRDIELAEKAKARVHIAHVSCKESVNIISRAKRRGVAVTAETAPHYFALTEEELSGYDTNLKMKPPLRTKEDMEAIRKGLKEGTIDVIASDHAPHTENEKDIEFDRAEFGVIGLETELAVSITELLHPGLLDWPELVEKLCFNPAKILGLNKGTLSVGRDADIVIVSPDKEWVVQKEEIVSKSRNSPFLNRKLKGAALYTICGGKIVYEAA